MTYFSSPRFEQKICPPDQLVAWIERLVKPRVFTNGCFDILHRGHVTYLDQSASLGHSLIVALNTDSSVRRLGKGQERPINPLENRLAVIASLACVDLVTWFEEDTPLNLIELIQPEILVKGGDWLPENIVGAKQTLDRGGQVYSIPFLYQTSTTALIKQICEQVYD